MTTFSKFGFSAAMAVAVGMIALKGYQVSKLQNEARLFKEQNVSLSNRVAELEVSIADARTKHEQAIHDLLKRNVVRPSAHKKEKEKELGSPATLLSGHGTNVVSETMSKIANNVMEQQLEGKMLALNTRLNLSTAQEATLRQILTDRANKNSQLMQQMFRGDGVKTDAVSNLRNDTLAEDDQIKSVLTPEQATAYDAFQKEEKISNGQLMANLELTQMQSMLQLDEAQQDKVFAVLLAQALAQPAQAKAGPDDSFDLRGQMERKAEALRGTLTPEQFKNYVKLQEQQLASMEALLRGSK